MSKLNYLSQNAKMKKIKGADVYNWGIPAFKAQSGLITCPNASKCATGCYAQSGAYRFSNVKSKYESRLELALSPQFENVLGAEIDHVKQLASKRDKSCLIRIHDSGDFFSLEYTQKWLRLIQSNPCTLFYAYTKQVSQFKSMDLPHNLRLIYSYGGKQDHLIDSEQDRHSRVFENIKQLEKAGYANASVNDMIALGPCLKIGLVFHHSKNYANTSWSKVKISK